MVFSSPLFLFFYLPVVLTTYSVLPKPARNAFLTLASLFFYAPWARYVNGQVLLTLLVGVVCCAPVASLLPSVPLTTLPRLGHRLAQGLVVAAILVASVTAMAGSTYTPFIYFRF